LPFTRKIVLVALLAIVGWFASSVPQLGQVGYGLSYVALISVSLVTVHAVGFGLVNAALAAAWLVPFSRTRGRWYFWVVFLNRQLGHIELFFVWGVLAFVVRADLAWQLPLLALVFLCAEDLASLIVVLTHRLRTGARPSRGDVLWARRPILYAFTVLGMLGIVALAPAQAATVLPLFLAISAATMLRLLKIFLRHRERRGDDPATRAARHEFREAQARTAQGIDPWVRRAIVTVLLFVLLPLAFVRRWASSASEEGKTPPADGAACRRDPGGPAADGDLSLFLVADTQLHELRGRPFHGQLALMDAFVPVALRPVELDLLSSSTFRHFAALYADLRAARPGMLWAALGDMTDLACEGELRRFGPLFAAMGPPGTFAGLAPGNHDSTFTGNFIWHPAWDDACAATDRLTKARANALFAEQLGPLLDPQEGRLVPVDRTELGGLVWKGALASVSRLGTTTHRQAQHGVIGVFFDTADANDFTELHFSSGIAGAEGQLSRSQIAAVEDALAELRQGPYRDPLYVLFFHHPVSTLNRVSRRNLAAFIARLEQDRPGARVLALVAAHTHLSRSDRLCLAGRVRRELVVGSTIDPPQEAAVLTIGPDAHGTAAASLRTIPAVARPGRTCPPEHPVAAADCQAVIERLAREPACGPLLTHGATTRSCDSLDDARSLARRLASVGVGFGPRSPEAVQRDQRIRAARLGDCLCRDGRCALPADLLQDHLTAPAFEGRLGSADPAAAAEAREELVCLSWAASVVQAHKAAGMKIADALRCGFLEGTLPPAKTFVASLEEDVCQ
jgi:hypothetical protein